jgi:ubiquinone/menaquinone biosynthesis C-methylase UbiE
MASSSLLDRVFAATSPEEHSRLYDEWAESYDSDMAKPEFTAPRLVVERVVKYLQTGAPADVQVLDAGCGSGAVGSEFAKVGFVNVDGLDISEGMLRVAKKTNAYRDLKIADLTKRLDVEDGAYDAVTCCGTFTHGHLGPKPLEEFARVVKKRGVLSVTILESFWKEGGFESEVKRLQTEGLVDILENDVHAYRKDAGGGFVLVLRKL